MSRKAYQYKIISGSKDSVETGVEELTQSGWEIHGDLQFQNISGIVIYVQAMIKEYEQPGAWG